MKRFLFLLLAALTIPSCGNAGLDKEVHRLCKDAKDYMGCVKSQSGDKGFGNKCPEGAAYIGDGKCTVVKCTYNSLWWGIQGPNDPLLVGKSTWNCPFSPWGGPGRLKPGVEVPITNSDFCPEGEPAIGWNSTCEAPYITKTKKEKPITEKKKPVKINCNSPIWKKKPICN